MKFLRLDRIVIENLAPLNVDGDASSSGNNPVSPPNNNDDPNMNNKKTQTYPVQLWTVTASFQMIRPVTALMNMVTEALMGTNVFCSTDVDCKMMARLYIAPLTTLRAIDNAIHVDEICKTTALDVVKLTANDVDRAMSKMMNLVKTLYVVLNVSVDPNRTTQKMISPVMNIPTTSTMNHDNDCGSIINSSNDSVYDCDVGPVTNNNMTATTTTYVPICISLLNASMPNTTQNMTRLANSCDAKKIGPTIETGPNHVENKNPANDAETCKMMLSAKHNFKNQSADQSNDDDGNGSVEGTS